MSPSTCLQDHHNFGWRSIYLYIYIYDRNWTLLSPLVYISVTMQGISTYSETIYFYSLHITDNIYSCRLFTNMLYYNVLIRGSCYHNIAIGGKLTYGVYICSHSDTDNWYIWCVYPFNKGSLSSHMDEKWDAITHPSQRFASCLSQSVLRAEHGWVITSYRKPYPHLRYIVLVNEAAGGTTEQTVRYRYRSIISMGLWKKDGTPVR